MCSSAPCTVLPCGSTTAFLGVMMIFAFIAAEFREREMCDTVSCAARNFLASDLDQGSSWPISMLRHSHAGARGHDAFRPGNNIRQANNTCGQVHAALNYHMRYPSLTVTRRNITLTSPSRLLIPH